MKIATENDGKCRTLHRGGKLSWVAYSVNQDRIPGNKATKVHNLPFFLNDNK